MKIRQDFCLFIFIIQYLNKRVWVQEPSIEEEAFPMNTQGLSVIPHGLPSKNNVNNPDGLQYLSESQHL